MPSFLNRYRLGEQVGTGAGSKIFLATDLLTGKTCAIKHVVRNSAQDDKFIEQVEAEYAVCHALDNPALRKSLAIHRVKKFFKTKEVYIAMEYIDGLPMETARPNRLNTFLALFQKVAMGLHAMHEAGYVHADIKPSNIMIGRGGVVKIIDFGQTCAMNHKKERVQGTPDYIAPEQVRRLQLDRRTDVFNLGATMYWVLTSEKYPTAIRGATQRGGVSITSAEKPLAPIELNDKIPLALSTLVMECCRENPAERPADMKKVASRLAAIQKLWNKQTEGAEKQRSIANGNRADEETSSNEPLA